MLSMPPSKGMLSKSCSKTFIFVHMLSMVSISCLYVVSKYCQYAAHLLSFCCSSAVHMLDNTYIMDSIWT
jgi:hypothetical protein